MRHDFARYPRSLTSMRCRRAVVVAVCWVLAAAARAEEPVLNVYSWADYIGPTTIRDFEAETGIKVNYDTYDSSETLDTKLLMGSTGYDVVSHDVVMAARLIPIGIFRPIARARLSHWRLLDPRVLEMYAVHDPGNRYAVPYTWGSTGFAYNVDMIRERMPDAPVDSGRMLFDPAVVSRFADCGVSFSDSPTDVIPLALIYLGLSGDSTDPADLSRVELMLRAVRPYVRYFSSSKMLLDMPNGDVCLAMSWSGDYVTAAAGAREAGLDIHLAYSVPKEGSVAWQDAWFIPEDAPHPENAYRFIDYILRPDVMASITNQIHYANPIPASAPMIDPAYLADPAIYPPDSVIDAMHVRLGLPPKAERMRTRLWARVKSGL